MSPRETGWPVGRGAPRLFAVAALPEVIDAGPLILRRSRPDDAQELLAAVLSSLAELRQWMHWAQEEPTPATQLAALAQGEAAFDAGSAYGFLLRELATGEVVGGVGAHRRIGPGAVEVGYWIRTDRHRRGYATLAAGALTDAVFTHLDDVDVVEIHMDRANVASARVPEKLGFRLLRTEQRARLAPAHTGETLVWQRRRERWTRLTG